MERFSVFVFAAFGLLLSACAGEIKIRHDIRSWTEARKACRNQVGLRSCDLISKTRLHEEWSKLGLSGDESYWVGGQRFFRWFWDAGNGNGNKLRLFEEHGCYTLPSVDVATLSTLQFNGPHQCYEACESRAFVYLLGDKCHCTHTLEGEVTSRDQCHLQCEGSADKCGGKNGHFSVYSIPPEIQFVDQESSLKCAAAQIKGDKLRVESTDCTRSRHYFCESDKQESEISTKNENFDTAVSRCETRHQSTLPTLSSYTEAGRLLSDLKSMEAKVTSFTTFWLPLRRTVRAVWVDGQEGEAGGEFGECIAATPRTASYRFTNLQCSQSHPAICDCSGSAINPDDKDKNGGGKSAEKPGPNTAIVVVIVIIGLLTVLVLVLLFIFLRRRFVSKRDLELAENDRWGNRENPTYKGTPEGGHPTDEAQKD